MTTLNRRIKEAARDLGFDVVGITSVEPLARDEEAFLRWCEQGFAAGMDYMTRRPELNARPKLLVPQAASLITLAVNYYAPAPAFRHDRRYGRVARYAWGRDYHDVIKPRLAMLAARIEEIAARPVRSRQFVDAVPLLERAAAARAGLGFFGKNTNLLQPRQGSWFFLAEILIDLELESEDRDEQIGCGTCSRCLDACPTDAFDGPYRLDSRRCISYLTIENKGAIPRDLRRGLGEWVFGCDVCQEMSPDATKHGRLPVIVRGQTESVCPFNRFAKETAWEELHPEAGVGPRLDLVEVLSISTDEEFRARFKGTPLTRPKRRGLLRNAAVVAANIRCAAAVPVLIERVERDPEPLIRSHALWALAELDWRKSRPLALGALDDPDPMVADEAASLISEERR
ncbi:MAG TPA: tRNA epoxyqueuosine(34) reductase QueG [Blastocatellia bacterium]|nr:tRNA epoxyqueuosine(34) reductase QueG [Blastocatellia bacterium]